MKLKKIKMFLAFLFLVLLSIILGFLVNSIILNEDTLTKNLRKANLKNIDKVMIVAHPDDEMLWGGYHLIKDKYLVVCVTCGDDPVREVEFENVMKEVDCSYLSLGYPDRNTWEDYHEDITKDLKKIFDYKEFNYIVTHNPDGEYGHDQHKKVSKYVTKLVDKNKLYYFNKYYTREELIDANMISIEDKYVKEKERILTIYESQKGIIENHGAMIPYEKFISYNEWNEK